MADTSVYNILMDGLRDRLVEVLIEGQPENEVTRAGLVKVGKLQDDPTETLINILIHEGRPDGDPHVLNVDNERPDLSGPTYEIGGGGSAWYRNRFQVEFKLFFDGDYDRDESRRKANVVLSRTKQAIMTIDLHSLSTDSFGERAHMVSVYRHKISEGGGEGTFIWRGDISVEFLCGQDF